MIHGRPDYRYITDLRTVAAMPDPLSHLAGLLREIAELNLEGKGISEDEPVFLLRGRDACAPGSVVAYGELARLLEAHEIADGADRVAAEMRDYQVEVGLTYTVEVHGCGRCPDLATAADETPPAEGE